MHLHVRSDAGWHITVKPRFISDRTLTVQKTGTGQGTVASAPTRINCGTDVLGDCAGRDARSS